MEEDRKPKAFGSSSFAMEDKKRASGQQNDQQPLTKDSEGSSVSARAAAQGEISPSGASRSLSVSQGGSESSTSDARFPRKTKKRKKVAATTVDDGKPKRPLSAYNFFFKHERIAYLEEMEQNRREGRNLDKPNDGFLSMSKEIGKRWMRLAPHEKTKFEEMASEALRKYNLEVEAYKAAKRTRAARVEESKVDPSMASASVSRIAGTFATATDAPSTMLQLGAAASLSSPQLQRQFLPINPTPGPASSLDHSRLTLLSGRPDMQQILNAMSESRRHTEAEDAALQQLLVRRSLQQEGGGVEASLFRGQVEPNRQISAPALGLPRAGLPLQNRALTGLDILGEGASTALSANLTGNLPLGGAVRSQAALNEALQQRLALQQQLQVMEGSGATQSIGGIQDTSSLALEQQLLLRQLESQQDEQTLALQQLLRGTGSGIASPAASFSPGTALNTLSSSQLVGDAERQQLEALLQLQGQRQQLALPQPNQSISATTSILGRSMPQTSNLQAATSLEQLQQMAALRARMQQQTLLSGGASESSIPASATSAADLYSSLNAARVASLLGQDQGGQKTGPRK